MDRLEVGKKITELLKKYRFAILILVLGLALMLIPGRSHESEAAPDPTQPHQTADLSAELEDILGKIQGAGEVKVLLSISEGEKVIYQADSDISGTDSRTDTVIITDADRAQNGLVQQIVPPAYLGAIIVCQGADNVQVKLAIVEAVSRLTGLGADRISVLKMK